MDLIISKSELLSGLYLSQGIAERRTTVPILSNVLLEAAGNTLTISATDQEIGVRRGCVANVKKPGAVTASARKLYEMARELPEGDLVIRAKDNSWIEVVAGKGRYRLVGLDPREFPEMPKATSDGARLAVKVPAETLSRMLEVTSFAMSADETRATLNGVLVEGTDEGTLRVVATDGHRLAMIDRPVEGAGSGSGAIIPRKAVVEIRKILEADEGDIDLIVGEGVAYVIRGPVEMSMRLIEGDFPDYNQVVPKKSPKVAKVEAAVLLAGLRRVSTVSSERTKGVKFDLSKGAMELSTINPEVGEGSEEVEVEYGGAAVSVGFNARYLIDLLAVLPGETEVQIGLNDEVSPGVVRFADEENYRYIVMPMRL